MNLQQLKYVLSGWYLRLGGGEQARWLPVADGPHHQFPSIEFVGGRIQFVDATNGERTEVSLADEFSELLIAGGDGRVLRLVKSGRDSACLVYPDGESVERLKASRYLPWISRHALTNFYVSGELGQTSVHVLSDGKVQLRRQTLPLTGPAPWTERLGDGSTLERVSGGLMVHRHARGVDCYVWDATARRLLRCDFTRREFHFVWASHGRDSTASIFDGVVTAYSENGDVQLWNYATKQRRQEIDCVGPGGIAVRRAAGSDRLWIFQHDELVGVADFVPNAGVDDNGRAYDRWAFAAVGYADLPRGMPAINPIATLLLLLLAAATPLAMVNETAGMVIVLPLAVVGVALFFGRGLLRLTAEVWG